MVKSIAAAVQRSLHPTTLAMWSLVAVAAVFMGPFGTFSSMSWEMRAVYWGLICGLSVFVSALVREYVQQLVPATPDWRVEVLHVLGVTLILTPVVFALTALLGQAIVSGSLRFWTVMIFVFLISTLVTALRRIYGQHHSLGFAITEEEDNAALTPLSIAVDPPESLPPLESRARLYERLPAGVTGVILHLSARDHFVDVELDGALVSLRMRFADAVAEMDGVSGHVTHRSHWVAVAAIDGTERDNGKLVLRLTNGSKVPVSRTAKPKLEEVGVL